MMIIRTLLLSILMLTSVGISFAKSGADSLQSHLQSYKQVSGQFTQIISSEKGNHTQSSTGEFWIKKPSQFRWHYSTPYIQKIISNGRKLWVYDEDLEQVTIKGVSQSIDSSPLAIILGSASLDKLFDFVQLEDNNDLQWLKLTPKTDSSGFEYINVGFKSGLLSRMVLQDNFGQTTRLLFTNVTVHTPLDSDLFEFKVPNGADVFDETVEQ
jgi:outer membrane lipoprotein carrier protein